MAGGIVVEKRSDVTTVTPMMQQYLQIKEQNKDCLLFFRVGDFYEMFYDDAVTASKELELVLTGKDCGQTEPKIETATNHIFMLLIYKDRYNKDDKIGYSFIKLCRMTRKIFAKCSKDKPPIGTSGLSHYL